MKEKDESKRMEESERKEKAKRTMKERKREKYVFSRNWEWGGVNFANVLQAPFTLADPKSAKRH